MSATLTVKNTSGYSCESSSISTLKKTSFSSGEDLVSQSEAVQVSAGSSGAVQPQYGVDFQRYALRTYLSLPLFLRPFVRLPRLRDFLVVGRPTMDVSAGLARYREAVPKSVRRREPFLVVVDRPGMAPPDDKYSWVEFPLPDVFKLDVSGMRSMEDYVQGHLRRRHRRAFRVRQQELEGSPISFEHVPLGPGDRALVDQLWELYLKNGQRHGFHVLTRRDFYRIHLAPLRGLTLLLARDNSRGGRIVTFCTGVRSKDTLMSMWCGTDYDNPLSRSCSTYINAQYEFIRIAVQDPDIRWLDLGAQLRQMKTGLGCEGHPVSGYLRCKSRVMRAVVQRMITVYFNPIKLLTDP